MKVIMADNISIDYSHLDFNKTFIKAVVNCSSVESLELIVSASQKDNIKKFLQVDKVQNISYLNNKSMNSNALSFIYHSLKAYYKLVRRIIRFKPDTLLLLAIDNIIGPILILLLKNIFSLEIIVLSHNNFDVIKKSKFKKWIWCRGLMKGIKNLFLSKFVLEKVKENFPMKCHPNLDYVPHPTYDFLFAVSDQKKHSYTYDFLILGRHSLFFKDSDFAKKICSLSKSVKAKRRFRLHVRKGCFPSNIDANFDVSEYEFPMSNNEYKEKLKQSRFLLIPPLSGERVTASGVHLDAITSGLPTIAPISGAFRENTSILGESLLYNSHNIEEVFAKALQMNDYDYEKLTKEINTMSESLSLQALTSRLNNYFKHA